ncbi:MAG: aspartate kinase [Myxococcota bacterium]|jgi:aspartate kinase|nr:aspartate kinase [Myxococcota bacterium]
MALLVQKYGGSSVGTLEKIRNVANRVCVEREKGTGLVVVVSAMQGETDRLLNLVQQITQRPGEREVDALVSTGEQVSAALLAITLESMGVPARSMSGAQMRIQTDGHFSRARIKHVDQDAFKTALDAGEVVVATGFQGVDSAGNVTTLGRGGSDTSAVALAAALNADECEIYTDVLGVFTADPRICPQAAKLDEICFEEMMEMASQGSKVLQIRSVELAMNHNVPIRVRSTFSEDRGTLVHNEDDALERLVVRGISHNMNEVKFTMYGLPHGKGAATKIFSALAEAQINVDVIVQNAPRENHIDLSFTLDQSDRYKAEDVLKPVLETLKSHSLEIDEKIGKVSIVGVGMRSHAGVAAAMFETLYAQKIDILMISTSEIKVTCVLAKDDIEKAVGALHQAFELA